jgi:hypothetical protein
MFVIVFACRFINKEARYLFDLMLLEEFTKTHRCISLVSVTAEIRFRQEVITT